MSKNRTIERPGSQTVYEVTGSGPPVMLGHSLLVQRTMWSGVVERLASDYTFINVALRGHGESSATAPFTVWDLADDWIAILEAEGIERAALVGLSTGGMTAMRMALRAPERVAGLALLDCAASRERAWDRAQYAALGAMYRYTGIIPVGKIAQKMFCKKTITDHPEHLDDLVSLIKTFDRRQVSLAMSAVFGRDSVDVSPIKAPTVVIVGDQDDAQPPARSEAMVAAIEGARLEIIVDAGHLTSVEQPEAVAAVLADFLPTCFASEAVAFYEGAFYARVMGVIQGKLNAFVVRQIEPGSTVLDAGCGTANLSLPLADRAAHVVGVELSDAMHAQAEARVAARGAGNIELIHGDVTTALADRADGSFDVAVMSMVLHEMAPAIRRAALRELARLAPEVLIVDFCAPMPRNLAGLRNRAFELAAGRDHHRAFRDFLRRGGTPGIAKECELVCEVSRTIDSGALTVCRLSR